MKRYSYLSERKYQHSKDGKSDNIKQRYWERMFGEDVMTYLCKNSGNFCCYLSGDEYYEEENIEKGLLTHALWKMKKVIRNYWIGLAGGQEQSSIFIRFYHFQIIAGVRLWNTNPASPKGN